MATSLDLAKRIPLTTKSFPETHIAEPGSELAKTLCSKTAVMASAVFQDCLILLRNRVTASTMPKCSSLSQD